jgi:glutamate racemase
MSQRRIGLLDSGLGGLTVLRRLLERHPDQPYIYLGDTARVPYGERSTGEIRAIAAEVVGWLQLQSVDVVLMACNTTHALALDVVEAIAGREVPVLGLIDSAAAVVQGERVGVLATPATAASGAYGRALRAVRPHTKVVEMGCPAFVPLIERGDLTDPQLREAAHTYLKPLLAADVDTVVLGCTHYPLLEDLLRELLPEHVVLVDPAEAAVARLSVCLGRTPAPVLQRCGLHPSPALASGSRFCVTGDPEAFAHAAMPWLGWRPVVEQVALSAPIQAF